jgi:aspartyl-tRNA(Asn)/glutamyl-tRNA(Gln) amidotransferase subunit A
VGPLARTVNDAAILLGVLAGRDPRDSSSSKHRVEDYRAALRKPLRKFRLGRPHEHYWEMLDDEVRRVTEAALSDLQEHGAAVHEVSLPHLRESNESATSISLAEARQIHEAWGYFPARAGEYTEEVRQRLTAGGEVSAVKYLEGLDMRKQIQSEFAAALQDVDAIVAPTVPTPAPPIGAEFVQVAGEQVGVRPALVGMSRPANFSGLPAISVPCGFTREGLPVGLQFIGRPFDETTLLRIAHSYERRHDWGKRHPCLI